MQWEYKFLCEPRREHADGWSKHDETNLQELLQKMGGDGWELIHMARQMSPSGYVARTDLVFKRPL